jgi:hypothetical protein
MLWFWIEVFDCHFSISATFAPPFQLLCHQQNVFHKGDFSADQTDEVTKGQVQAVKWMFKKFRQ